nr:putative senescence regulator S40 [Ipomoea batatas]
MASEISFKPNSSDLQFEFDESEDCWVRSTTATNNEVAVSGTRWSAVEPNLCHVKTAVMHGESSVVEQEAVTAVAVRSLPMKIPDRRRILGVAYQQVERARQDSDYNAAWSVEEDEDEYFGLRPHVYLARTKGASLSGRSVKGRDLWRLRNAIWKQIGFED